MRVAQLSFSGIFGGREKVAVGLVRALKEAGHDCTLHLVLEERVGRERLEALLESVRLSDDEMRLHRTSARFSLPLLRELAGAMRRERAEVMHCHCYKSLFYALLLRRLGLARAAVAYTLHGLVVPAGVGSSLIRLAQKLSLGGADGVIGCSREILSASLPATLSEDRKARTRVIINAVELPAPSFAELREGRQQEKQRLAERYGLPEERPVVINVGRLTEQKDFFLYLRLIRGLADRGALKASPLPEASFLVVGDGALEKALHEEAARLGIEDRVVFTGFVTDMDAVYRGADLLVQTSSWEGTPMCLLEARSYGLPVVAPSVGGNVDVVHSGADGELYPVGDADALAAATERYLADADLRERHGRAAFEDVGRRFGTESWAREHLDFYAKMGGNG